MKKNRSVPESKLNVALVGAGKMGINHLKVINSIPSANILGVVDMFADGEAISTILGRDVPIYSNLTELYKNSRPDVVHIVTPPKTHHPIALEALANGSNVMVEKPFTLTFTDAINLVEVAEKNNLQVCPGHQLLFQESIMETKKLLPFIGDIIHLESYFSFRTARHSIKPSDQLIDILPHPTYLLNYFLQYENSNGKNNVEIVHSEVEAKGEVRALLQCNNRNGMLIVSLAGRPVDSYMKIIGTNGSITVDLVRGVVLKNIGEGADAVAAILYPYRLAAQSFWKSTMEFAKLFFSKNKSYPGLRNLIETFYRNINENQDTGLFKNSIIQTVNVCEKISDKVKDLENREESTAKTSLENQIKNFPPTDPAKGRVLVTGGTGFLGTTVVKKLRTLGWPVSVFSRSETSFLRRIAGVEYFNGDLAGNISDDLFKDVKYVLHCAAETAGGKKEHERNSINATKNIIEKAAEKGVKNIIHVSSIAVLKTGRKTKHISEDIPVDLDNLGRGPYVWGKAQSEDLADKLSGELKVNVRILRPGPLVDFKNFTPPGRLGREVGSRFVVMGSKKSKLSVCDVNLVAKIIPYYLNHFEKTPRALNIVEPVTPTRKELISMFLEKRKDLKAFFLPSIIVTIISTSIKVVLKILSPTKKPIDIKAAFGSLFYDTTLVDQIVKKAEEEENN